MSGYTQRRNKAGEVNDEYVYSIKFLREIFENSILDNVKPMDFCMIFENRCNITSTMLMKKYSPMKNVNNNENINTKKQPQSLSNQALWLELTAVGAGKINYI